ncbi:MAG: hypothetical protein ABID09_03645 [Candidatus Omnitrophota bacterium]
MERISKIALIVLAVLCVIFISSTIFLYVTKLDTKEGKTLLQVKVDELTSNEVRLNKVIKGLDQSKRMADRKSGEFEESIKKLTWQLNQEKNQNLKFTTESKKKDSEIAKVKTDFKNLEKEKASLLKRITLLNKSFDDIKIKFDKLIDVAEKESQVKVEALHKRVERLLKEKETTSLGTVVIR